MLKNKQTNNKYDITIKLLATNMMNVSSIDLFLFFFLTFAQLWESAVILTALEGVISPVRMHGMEPAVSYAVLEFPLHTPNICITL